MSDLTHAMLESTLCLAPGLFRSMKRGSRKASALDVTYRPGHGVATRFRGAEPLGADDMRLLQVLVALAGPVGAIVGPTPQGPLARRLRHSLNMRGEVSDQDAIAVRMKPSGVLSEMGLSNGGANIRAVRASLRRMSEITVEVEPDTGVTSFSLLSYAMDECRVNVALNPHMAGAVLGSRRYARIELSEAREIRSAPARILHQRLCGWIDAGKTRKVAIDTLCQYLALEATQNRDTMKSRRRMVRGALLEFIELGWTITEYSFRKYRISRPLLS